METTVCSNNQSISQVGGDNKNDTEVHNILYTPSVKLCLDHDRGIALSWCNIQFEPDLCTTNEQNEITINKDIILGSGTFGTVIRALLISPPSSSQRVAIKVLASLSAQAPVGGQQADFGQVRLRALKEATILTLAKRRLRSTEHIIDALGYIDEALPCAVSALLGLPPREPAVCLVLRYEGGESLLSLINSNNKVKNTIPMQEKLRLLLDIATGLRDLHAAGIVHADIKPENVLLSDDDPPHTRLADFGLSLIRSDESTPSSATSVGISIEAKTNRTQGTLTYCAPEMLVNPYHVTMNVNELALVAKASRRTDMYAFALLAWQLMAQRRPFSEVKGEVMLCSHVHSGARPSLSKLPSDTPDEVVSMITACWDKERGRRLEARDCIDILHRSLQPYLQLEEHSLVVPLPAFDKPKSPLRSSFSSFISTRRRSGSADSLESHSGSGTDFAALRRFIKLRVSKIRSPGEADASADGPVDPQLLSIYSDLDGDALNDSLALQQAGSSSQLGSDISVTRSWSRSFVSTIATSEGPKAADAASTITTVNPLRLSRSKPFEEADSSPPSSPPRPSSPPSESRRGSRRNSARPRDSRDSFGSLGRLSDASLSPVPSRRSSAGSLSRIVDSSVTTDSRRFHGRVRDSAGRLSSEFKAELKASISSKVISTLNGSDEGSDASSGIIEITKQFSDSDIAPTVMSPTEFNTFTSLCGIPEGQRSSDEGVSVFSMGTTTASLSRPVSDSSQCRNSTDDAPPSPARLMLRIPSFPLSFRSSSSEASSPVREEKPSSPSRLSSWFGSFRKEVSS